MIYLILFAEFFYAGLLSLGGGLATLPYLYDMANRHDWFTQEDLANMIAVSESTPGPIGINCATYAGYTASGILGGVVATAGLVFPSLIIIIIVAHFLKRFRESTLVKQSFYGLRPVVTALIGAACFEVLRITIFSFDRFEETGVWYDLFALPELLLFAVLLVMVLRIKWHPIAFIGIGALCGIVFSL